MPTPTAREVIALRWRVRIVLRLATFALTLVSLAWAALRLPDFLRIRRFAGTGFAPSPDPLALEWFAFPAAIFAVAVFIALVAQFGIKMIVEVPKPSCPGCGYDLGKPSGDKCPECGLRIGVPRSSSRANDPA
ncbi:MAG: hypothetical protein NCW75_15165 [Phycisphaera sp.]|nr:MAG: hypothetical protein NCW75_15165 [Phycisphaera sp.]